MATTQQREFVNRFWSNAVAIGEATGFFPELIMATWAKDTAWGTATGMMNCHALLGIVCFDPGRYPCTLCNESLCFYCYPTWDDFFDTFTEVMNQSHYDVVRARSTLYDQAWALANETGFAGGESTYFDSLWSYIQIVQSIIPPPPPPPPPPLIGDIAVTFACTSETTVTATLIWWADPTQVGLWIDMPHNDVLDIVLSISPTQHSAIVTGLPANTEGDFAIIAYGRIVARRVTRSPSCPPSPPNGDGYPVYPIYPESGLPYAFMFGALVLYGMYVHSFVSKKKLLLKYPR